ncbi:hypothetical protein LCGC14_2931640, partial [marine sediment metagenome]
GEQADRFMAQGMVTCMFRGGASVRIGPDDVLCSIAKTFRAPPGSTPLTVGDEVTVAMTSSQHVSGDRSLDKDRADGVILSRQLRETALSRPPAFRNKRRDQYGDAPAEKVIVANMDVLLIVSAVKRPRSRPGLIDRFCILAERGDMAPIVVFNKIDLGAPDESLLAELSGSEIEVHCCSAQTGEGLATLLSAVEARRCVLAGASGVGKSTLVKIIYGVLHANEGEMLWEGSPVTVADPHAARNLGVGMVFQHFSLFEAMTVLENIALGIEKAPDMRELAERVIEVSTAYGLPLDPGREVHTLSVGERQRIEIVRCLLQNPRLLIMDEPTSVLTPQEVDRLFETLRQLASEGVSILYISHKLDEIKVLCDRATILRAGKV